MTVKELFKHVGIQAFQCVEWGQAVPCFEPGIYIVSTSADADMETTAPLAPVFNDKMIQSWIDRLPAFTLDGAKPTVESLKERLAEFWQPIENVLYIGMTTRSLQERVNEYYETSLGAKAPHSGGQWLKTLANLGRMHVYCAPCLEPKAAKDTLLAYFLAKVGEIPFANLDGHHYRKQHGMKKQREE